MIYKFLVCGMILLREAINQQNYITVISLRNPLSNEKIIN